MPEENTPSSPPQAIAVLIKTPFQLTNPELTATLRASRLSRFVALPLPRGSRMRLGQTSAPVGGWTIYELPFGAKPRSRAYALPEMEARRRVALLNAGCASGFHSLN